MKIQRQREIVVEFERIEIVRKRTRTRMIFCRECREETDFLGLTEAASLFSTPTEKLMAFVHDEHCHFETDNGGEPCLCLASLLGRMKTQVSSDIPKLIRSADKA